MKDEVNFPSYDEIKRLLLRYLEEHGAVEPKTVYEPLADQLGLTKEQRTAPREEGGTLWQNKVQWARQALKNKGYLTDDLRVWKLSKAGRAAVLGKLNLKQLA